MTNLTDYLRDLVSEVIDKAVIKTGTEPMVDTEVAEDLVQECAKNIVEKLLGVETV